VARVRVQRRLDEAQAGKQAPVAGQGQPHAEVQPRQAAPPCLGLRGMHEFGGKPLAPAVGCRGEPAEVEAAVLLRPQYGGDQLVLHGYRPAARGQVRQDARLGLPQRAWPGVERLGDRAEGGADQPGHGRCIA
jgi:hypothetical protein